MELSEKVSSSNKNLQLVRATKAWKQRGIIDKEVGRIREVGEEFYITKERYWVLRNDNPYNLPFVEKIDSIEQPRTLNHENLHESKVKTKDYMFSIIIPCYNDEVWLNKCLTSVLNQEYKNFEIIFVDDMSEDNSYDVAKKMLAPPHKAIQLKMKRFNGGARNEGIIRAKGDYIVFLDSDDWLKDKKVLMDYNENLYGQDVMFVGLEANRNGKALGEYRREYKNKYDAMASPQGASCLKVIKRELAQKHLYNEGTLMEDRNHHCRICYYMEDFTNLKRVGVIWNRANTTSVTTIRDKALWGTAKWRNLADAKQFLIEIEEDRDYEAIKVMKDRIREIETNLSKTDGQY